MTQTTDTDSRELKDLIQSLDRKIELGFANIDLKLAEIKGDIKALDTRVVEVEKKIDKQDTRLWAFGGIVLSAALGIAIKLLAFPDH